MFGRTFLSVIFKLVNTGLKVQPFAAEIGMISVSYADNIKFQSFMLHQFRLLDADLFQQVASDRTDARYEKV